MTTNLHGSSSAKQHAGSGTLGSSAFGSSSAAAVVPSGNSIFGLNSLAMTSVNSQSQGSLFGSSASLPGAQGSATSLFASPTQSQSIQFGLTSSSFFGLSGNASFSSWSAIAPSSSVTDAFSSGSSIGLSTSASPSTVNGGSSTGATSSLFGSSSWQTKSPFSSTFNSSSSSVFSFGVSSGPVSSTSSSPMFGSSTASIASTASTSMFGSFPSVASTSTPMFGSSAAVASIPVFGSSIAVASPTSMPMFGSSASSVSATTSTPTFVSSLAISATTSTPIFGSSATSVASTTRTPIFGSSAVASTTSTPVFGSSLGSSSSPIFSFTSSAMATSIQPVFVNPNPAFPFGSAANNDQMSMEDSMAEDPVQSSSPLTPVVPAFGQQPAPPQSNFAFGEPSSSGTSPFQFGTQPNIAPTNLSTGSFSLVTGGVDKSSRRIVRVSKNRARKKQDLLY